MLKSIIIGLLTFLYSYLIITFAEYDFNIIHWSSYSRLTLMIIMTYIVVIISLSHRELVNLSIKKIISVSFIINLLIYLFTSVVLLDFNISNWDIDNWVLAYFLSLLQILIFPWLFLLGKLDKNEHHRDF